MQHKVDPTQATLELFASEGLFDAHTDLLAAAARADVALVSNVEADRQVHLGRTTNGSGIGRVLDRRFSVCALAIERASELVVDDLAADPDLHGHPIHSELRLRSYAGVPVHLPDGTMIGTVCVLSHRPRKWTRPDLQLLRDLAVVVDGRLAAAVACHERERQVEDLRTRLLLVGHEVGNALTVALNGVVTANRPDVGAPLRERLLDTVEQASQQAARLLDAVLRADDRAAVRPQEVDLGELLLRVARRHGSRDRITCADTTRTLRTDPVLLRHVVDNLLDNAVKYGGPDISIEVEDGLDGAARITVADDGPGIDPAVLEDLLSPFRRQHPDGKGYGLGLFLVRELVERLGGAIELGPGPGTRLTVSIPDHA